MSPGAWNFDFLQLIDVGDGLRFSGSGGAIAGTVVVPLERPVGLVVRNQLQSLLCC